MSSADQIQPGGDHYKVGGALQHWNMAAANHLGYFEAATTKYVTRWRTKGVPRLDLQKAKHYLEKLLELAAVGAACPVQTHKDFASVTAFARRVLPRVDMDAYADANKLGAYERAFCKSVVEWADSGNMAYLTAALDFVNYLLEECDQVEAEATRKRVEESVKGRGGLTEGQAMG
jgi:hypothetical protein